MWLNPVEICGDGIDQDNPPDFIDDCWGWNFVNGNNNTYDKLGHGTHVAGIIGAIGNNMIGVAGVLWNVKILPAKIFDLTAEGTVEQAAEAIDYVRIKGAKISNHSWTTFQDNETLRRAIRDARDAGHLIIAAAGNEGSNNDAVPVFPCSYSDGTFIDVVGDNVICVAATDRNDQRALYPLSGGASNYGLRRVSLAAPGKEILSTWLGFGAYEYSDGTSMATPHVTGVVGLMKIQNPGDGHSRIKENLLLSARPLTAYDSTSPFRIRTGGIVNAYDAINAFGDSLETGTDLGPRFFSNSTTGARWAVTQPLAGSSRCDNLVQTF